MTEENTNVSVEAEAPKPVPSASPKVVREAEHKLKEMSRKAKERKTAHNASKQSKGLSEVNYFWLVIGGLGALGVGYLVFGKKDPEVKPRPRFKFVRTKSSGQSPPPPKPKTPEKVKEPIVEKESVLYPSRVATPKFELNCF